MRGSNFHFGRMLSVAVWEWLKAGKGEDKKQVRSLEKLSSQRVKMA